MNKIRIFIILLGIILTINALIASVTSNMHLGIILTYLIGIFIISCGIFYRKIIKVIPKLIRYFFMVAFVFISIFVSFVYIYGNTDNTTYNEDAVIVLGAGIQGEEVSPNLKSRLDATINYYNKNPEVVIVVSGGQGAQEDITESLAMERYLISAGISSDKIIKEEAATSTEENFQYSKNLIDSYFEDEYSVAFITNNYHIYRAELIAKEVGFDNISHSHNSTPWYLVIPNGFRESLAILKQWILP